jgi:hypothetical protein
MGALGWVKSHLFQGVTVQSKPLPEPEPVFCERRPATGLFAALTLEQRARVLRYHGVENFGDPEFRITQKHKVVSV